MEKSPISSLKIFSPTTTKSKINACSKGSTINNTSSTNTSCTTSSDKDIPLSLYDARTESNLKNGKRKLREMHNVIYSHNKNIPMLPVIDLKQEKRINISFGTMPVGSALSNQCMLIPPDFNIYCNFPDPKKFNQIYVQYLLFPFKETKGRLSQYIVKLKDDQKFKFIHGMKVASSEIEFIEASTREQTNDPAWFKHRRYRFIAPLSNKIGDTSPKTLTELKTVAQNIVHGNEKTKKVFQYKLAYVRNK